ncbi:diguanylate cyclase response regulator [Desulfolithobacter dissulfuricans]|uniref:diguanylate cyclase n=1 Tax=Desulfolithobacter dissulfuricans TaxID=2795293 RepID=A0A915U3X5_9BACT|nr:diguanylate cyclase [Desulfolithobacter dissulfuricans]BCO10838.1 diguanylate cyclase response regulator [Desulfolithobacter dissulfuricans]
MTEPRRPSLLLADDSRIVTKLLSRVLGEAGYRVTAVQSGDEALALAPRLMPDLILLDVDMPGLSGFEVCRRLKKDPALADIPVLFVTARNEKEDIVTGFAAGGQDYVTKPYTQEELLARVQTHLALKQAQEKLKASEARYRELAIRDDLTGFYNTRYLYQTLQGQLDMHRAQNRHLSVIFMDIDNFKNVVDTYGHLNGSRIIAELADVVRQGLPADCYGVSYGGDEFVIVLTGHDREQGRIMAEKIRRAIEEAEFLAEQGLSIHITVSCGLATFPDDAQTLTDLLAHADHALFAAKNQGKNHVTAFSEL